MKKYIFGCFLTIWVFNATGQTAKKYKSKTINEHHYLTIKIKVSDAEASDTLKIEINTLLHNKIDYLAANYALAANMGDGLFVFRVPMNTKYGYFIIKKLLPIANAGPHSDRAVPLTDQYYWTAGDDIQITLTKKSEPDKNYTGPTLTYFYHTSFSGKGYQKYQLKNAEDSVFNRYANYRPSRFDDHINDGRDSVIKYLDRNSKIVSKTDIEVLKANYLFGLQNFSAVVDAFNDTLKKNKNLNTQTYLTDFHTYQQRFIRQVSKTALSRSINFPIYAQYEAEAEYIMSHNGGMISRYITSSVKLDNILPIIIKEYKGRVRDKIIANLFFSSLSQVNKVSVKEKAFAAVSTLEIKNELIKLLDPQADGSFAYDFNLPDTAGVYHSLKSLKGKVVYQDFWYVGCGACALLYQTVLKDVEEHYKHNPKVQFVSISCDPGLERVKSGIRKGIYNSPLSLNLYSKGKGMNHEIFKYYGVISFPTVILIDKNGRIIKYDTEDIKFNSKDKLVAQIDRLLKE